MSANRIASAICILGVACIALIFVVAHRPGGDDVYRTKEDIRAVHDIEMLEAARERLARLSPADVARDTTSDWKTYRAEKYNIEIKYPSDWYLHSTTERGAALYLIEHLPAWEVDSYAFGPHIGFQAEEMNFSSPETYIQQYIDQPWSPNEKPKFEWTSVNNLKAARIEVPGWVTRPPFLNYMVFDGKTVYQITLDPYHPSEPAIAGLNALFLKIVSTLKITESAKP